MIVGQGSKIVSSSPECVDRQNAMPIYPTPSVYVQLSKTIAEQKK